MRLKTLLIALIIAALFGDKALAEDISFIGKTFSPNHMEVLSPHATPEEMKLFEAMAKEVKEKRGEDAEPPAKPFTGRMKVMKIMADIGHKVDLDQRLLEYAFPPEDLQGERRKLSQAGLMSLEANVERLRTDLAAKRRALEEARIKADKGLASRQELDDLARDVDISSQRLRSVEENLRLERELAKGDLELAKAKFGSKTTASNLPSVSWINSPVAGYVLWTNPEVKAGAILTKKTRLFAVGSLDPILVRAMVHEIHVAKLRVGDKASIVFDTIPGKTFEAAISRIPMTANQTDVQLPSHFEVELSLPNPGLALKEGMRGQVTVRVPDGPR